MTRHQKAVLFSEICSLIWGAHWQKEAAAADLGVKLSSVVRYAKGEREIPTEVFERLADIVDAVIEELAARKPALNRAAGSADAGYSKEDE